MTPGETKYHHSSGRVCEVTVIEVLPGFLKVWMVKTAATPAYEYHAMESDLHPTPLAAHEAALSWLDHQTRVVRRQLSNLKNKAA